MIPDPDKYFPPEAWVKHYSIRDRNAIGAGSRIVAWWPREDREWVLRQVQNEIGLNDVEIEEVDRIARFIDYHNPEFIDHSEAGLGRYLDTITAARDLAFIARNVALGEDHAQRLVLKVLGDYDLEEGLFPDRVLALVAFFKEWPPLILFRWEARQKRAAT